MDSIRSWIGPVALGIALMPGTGCGTAREPAAGASLDDDLLESSGLERLGDSDRLRSDVGAIVYVPIYSHIALDDPDRTQPLAATLSIRNTDPEWPIVLESIRYFGTEGRQIRGTKRGPYRLAPLASTEVVVRERDLSGGSGANFLVEWSSASASSPPVIQAVMIGSAGNMGISFVCEGTTIRRSDPAESRDAFDDHRSTPRPAD